MHVEDVLRAAVAEVEDYTRVEVVVVTGQAALIGEAVADIIHLLAELIENATVFSPAPTEVLVRGEMGANGFAVDVIDRGIGLDQSELDALNLRLSRPPSSTWPSPTGSACSSSPGSPDGTASGSPCSRRCTGASAPSC